MRTKTIGKNVYLEWDKEEFGSGLLHKIRSLDVDYDWIGNLAIQLKNPEDKFVTSEVNRVFPGTFPETIPEVITEAKVAEPIYDWIPYEFQKEAVLKMGGRAEGALFMDMGTGKSATCILEASKLYWNDGIDAIFIIAPNNVQVKWIYSEFSKLWPKNIPYRAGVFRSVMTKEQEDEIESILKFDGMKVVAINYEAFASKTKKAEKFAIRFFDKFRTYLILDESHFIKTPSAKRTRTIVRIGKKAKFRRILTGTPGQPPDYYSQFNFLNWNILPYKTYAAFKQDFCVMTILGNKLDKEGNPILIIATDSKGRKKYKNINRLRELCGPYVFRVRKDDVLDLPEKLYDTILVELSERQQKIYRELCVELITEFEGKEISATHALQKLTRLRQCIGGYLPGETEVLPIDEVNPRIEAVLQTIEGIAENEKIVIWAQYQAEIEALYQAIEKKYFYKAVLYYGKTSDEDKKKNLDKFRNLDFRFFISNPACGGTGLDLYESSTMIFFTNSYSLNQRLQAEDRIHRIGQKAKRCLYLDCFSPGTIEEKIVNALIAKKEVESQLQGDTIIKWLKEGAESG